MKVIDCFIDAFWKGEVCVRGTVEDEEKTYKVRIRIRGSQVFDYSCSCIGGHSDGEMCGHCKALFKEYSKHSSDNKKTYVSTSPAIRLMVREYTNHEVAKIMGEEETGRMRLVPKLIIDHQGVKMECRIGQSRLYQIKDLSIFAQTVENGQYVEYGKGLAFNHSVGAFDSTSEPMVRLVMELAGSYREHYEQMRKGTMAALPSFRSLALNKTGCDRFFEIVEGETVETEDFRGQERVLCAVSQNPPLVITVKREGSDGIKISIPENIMAFSGEKHLYVVDDEYLYQCDERYTETLTIFLEQMIRTPGSSHEVAVNRRDIPLFYERVLRQLELLGILENDGINLEEYRPEELKARFEFDSISPDEISLNPILSYGDYSFHPLDDEKVPSTVCRDVPGEFRISRVITRYFSYKEDGTKNLLIRDDENAIYRLLSEGLEEFQAIGDVYLSESFSRLKILPSPKIAVGVSMNGSWLELDVDADGMSGAELSRVLSEYTKKKKYHRMKNGEFLKLDDDGLLTLSKLTEGLSIGKTELQSRKIQLAGYRALYLDSILKEDSRIAYQRDSRFRTVIRGMKSVEDSGYEIPPNLNGVLRAYQKTGFCWLKTLDEYRFGGILADDMGLGKTIQMISLLLDFANSNQAESPFEEKTSLVVCPASLVYNWSHEFAMFAPSLNVVSVTGTLAERKKNLEEMEQYDVVITSYDLLKRDIAFYKEKSFRYEVIDEAQYIKNASTQSARTVKAVHAITRFALTGTPVENRLSELWSIFDYLMPGFLFGYRKFKTMFEIPIVKDGDQKALANLHRMIKPFVLRRLKSDVLKELPDKLEKIVYSAFVGKQKELYAVNALQLKQSIEKDSVDVSGRGKLQILSELTRLRQICCDPALCYESYESGSAKLETCVDLLTGAVSAGHKILLFSQFASMLEIIGKRIEREGISFYKLTGSTPKEERIRLVNAFNKDDVSLFLISLKAGGTGLNLTAADIVIHYDPWWNVAAQNQATDRAHRIGQSKQVTVYKLIMEHTIEENIMKLQETKQCLAEQIVTEGMLSLSGMGKEELLKILS
ncbi:MAG: SNF2 helicase associated domain-containing protein [Clostridium sp.]